MKILVATDGSKPALQAVESAAQPVRRLAPGLHRNTRVNVQDDVGLRHARVVVGGGAMADDLRKTSDKESEPARKVLDAAGIAHDMVQRTAHVPVLLVK